MMLADGAAAQAVGSEALAAMAPGSVLVDMGTSGPAADRAIASACAERGIGFVDSPVSGSIALARAGTLTALVGGSAEHVELVRPALAAMTRAQHHLGGVGSGATVKLAINTMIAVTNESISELLVLCERAGLERAAAYAALADSALASPFVHYKQAAFLAPDDEPVGFTPHLMLKDLALAEALAAELGVDLPATEAARTVLERTVASGQGDGDLVRVADTLRQGTS
jgi:3-hydroxyisobutyrate dehydrogenase-like beta-hydroxyacid dehydrogenase